MCLKIRCDGESEKFYKISWELNRAMGGWLHYSIRERRKKRATKEAPQHTQQWSGRERDTSRARKLLASLYAVEGRLQEREKQRKRKKSVGDFSGDTEIPL
jgi:hypothetical protein